MSLQTHTHARLRARADYARAGSAPQVDLLLFYTPLGMGQLGESWSVWSYMQAAGFVVLVTGTLVYRCAMQPAACSLHARPSFLPSS